MKAKEAKQKRPVIHLSPDALSPIRSVDKRLMSYNIEMAEITGGTFWKAYTPGQIAGTEAFPPVRDLRDITAMDELMQYYPPIDLYHPQLRALARALGPAWVRVSGTWATKTYYDFGRADDCFNRTILDWPRRGNDCNTKTDPKASKIRRIAGQAEGSFLFLVLFPAGNQLLAWRPCYHVFGRDKNTLLEEPDGRRLGDPSRHDFGDVYGGGDAGSPFPHVLDLSGTDDCSCSIVRVVLFFVPAQKPQKSIGHHRTIVSAAFAQSFAPSVQL